MRANTPVRSPTSLPVFLGDPWGDGSEDRKLGGGEAVMDRLQEIYGRGCVFAHLGLLGNYGCGENREDSERKRGSAMFFLVISAFVPFSVWE